MSVGAAVGAQFDATARFFKAAAGMAVEFRSARRIAASAPPEASPQADSEI